MEETWKGGIMTTKLFKSVPEDLLNLYENKEVQCDRIQALLNFKKKDVSKAVGMRGSPVRLDGRMPALIRERIQEWATLLNLVGEHFDGDTFKTTQWFTTLNPELGDISPRDMIKLGRYKKLYKFVINALEENSP